MAWTIEVCRTCGQMAQWPYCEHRALANYGDPPWCVAVTVRASPGSERRLRKMMKEASVLVEDVSFGLEGDGPHPEVTG